MARPKGPSRVTFEFVDDLRRACANGDRTRQQLADDFRISLAAFDQRVYRARKAGLLPPAHQGPILDLFGNNPSWTAERSLMITQIRNSESSPRTNRIT